VASKRFLLITAALGALFITTPLHAETLPEALASAYANNPTLNSARASTRATDEEVPQALSGYRPSVNANLQASGSWQDTLPSGSSSTANTGFSRGLSTGITVTQPIFLGFRTQNSVKAAEAAVEAARESLRNTEQNVLFDAAEAYMNVIRDSAILNLRQTNVRFLTEQVRAARDRFQVGEGTRTDVAQAEAAVAGAESDVSLAQANLQSSRAIYRQVIGRDPEALKAAKGVDNLLPRSLGAATEVSRDRHPAILASQFNADTAAFNVKIIEGELLPSVTLEGNVSRSWNDGFNSQGDETNATILGRISIPLYEGGQVYSRVRQAKETLGQRKIEVDTARDQVQAALISAWGSLEAARAQIVAARSGVEASQLALEGVIEEQRVGQRTTLDVLDAQNVLIDARVALVRADRDAVVASYAVLSAVGRLSSEDLSLQVATYKPEKHYKQVRDKWIGLRTPDGR
jgi:outer membrane protein